MIDKLSEVQWDFICKLDSKLENLSGISEEIIVNLAQWKEYISGDILNLPIPNKYNLVDPFTKILLIKALRSEKLMYSIDNYASKTLGEFFSQVPLPSIEALFEESDKKTPILFILSQGSDPIEDILKLCRDKGMMEKIQMISLGQGQGIKAQDAIEKFKSQGG